MIVGALSIQGTVPGLPTPPLPFFGLTLSVKSSFVSEVQSATSVVSSRHEGGEGSTYCFCVARHHKSVRMYRNFVLTSTDSMQGVSTRRRKKRSISKPKCAMIPTAPTRRKIRTPTTNWKPVECTSDKDRRDRYCHGAQSYE